YIFDLLKITLPAVIVLATTVIVLKKVIPRAGNGLDPTVSLRLQAYERLVLLVERISPASLFLRNHKPGLSATELNALLIAEIRAEFEHNLTQQLYVSERSWQMTRTLKDKTVSMINGIAQGLAENATGMDLTRAVLDHVSAQQYVPYQETLAPLKEAVKALF